VIASDVRFIFLESVKNSLSARVSDTQGEAKRGGWGTRGMEDLLERLEAAELLIAFATVCRKVHSRYAAQVFNYERPVGSAFQDDYQATIISDVLPPDRAICLCQLPTSVERP